MKILFDEYLICDDFRTGLSWVLATDQFTEGLTPSATIELFDRIFFRTLPYIVFS